MSIDQELIKTLKKQIDKGKNYDQDLFISLAYSYFLGFNEQINAIQKQNSTLKQEIVSELGQMRKEVHDASQKLETNIDKIIDDIEELKKARKRYPSITWLLGNKLKTTVSVLIGFVLAIISAKDYLWLLIKGWLNLP